MRRAPEDGRGRLVGQLRVNDRADQGARLLSAGGGGRGGLCGHQRWFVLLPDGRAGWLAT
jgi:hypothetical protein